MSARWLLGGCFYKQPAAPSCITCPHRREKWHMKQRRDETFVCRTYGTPDPAPVNTSGPDVSTRAWTDMLPLSRLCLLTCFAGYSFHLV